MTEISIGDMSNSDEVVVTVREPHLLWHVMRILTDRDDGTDQDLEDEALELSLEIYGRLTVEHVSNCDSVYGAQGARLEIEDANWLKQIEDPSCTIYRLVKAIRAHLASLNEDEVMAAHDLMHEALETVDPTYAPWDPEDS